MSQVGIVAVCEDSSEWYGDWNQVSGPIDRSIRAASMIRAREWIQFSNFGGRFIEFAVIALLVLAPLGASLMSPCSFWVAGEPVNEDDAFGLAKISRN